MTERNERLVRSPKTRVETPPTPVPTMIECLINEPEVPGIDPGGFTADDVTVAVDGVKIMQPDGAEWGSGRYQPSTLTNYLGLAGDDDAKAVGVWNQDADAWYLIACERVEAITPERITATLSAALDRADGGVGIESTSIAIAGPKDAAWTTEFAAPATAYNPRGWRGGVGAAALLEYNHATAQWEIVDVAEGCV